MLSGKRIFLLEDDVNSLAIIMSMIKRNNAVVFYDTWGIATIEKIQRHLSLDLIIMDLNLPGGISGYDIFAQIKKVPALGDIPIVLVTGAESQIEMPKARSMGFAGFISKPVRNRTFPYALAQILKGESVWGKVKDLPSTQSSKNI
jgi:CheY-like chemotaxis protein